MARTKPAPIEASPEEIATLDAVSLASAEPEDGVSDGQRLLDEVTQEDPIPTRDDAGWNEYVLSQFAPDEIDKSGRPYVKGLRRVGPKLLGLIVESRTEVVSPPRYSWSPQGFLRIEPTTVTHHLKLMVTEGDYPVHQEYYADSADVHEGNTQKDYAIYPTAMASTRAEGRAWKRALRLQTVCAEEVGQIPEEENPEYICPTQVQFLDNLCKRLQLGVMAYINLSDKKKYKNINEIPYDKAVQMVEHLNDIQGGRAKLSDAHRAAAGGYDPNWRIA